MIEYRAKESCPKCKALNVICLPDADDLTAYEPDGFECAACGHKWLFENMDPDWVEVSGGAENMNYEKGQAA